MVIKNFRPKEEPVDELPVKSAESLPDTSVATEGPDEVTNERSTPTDGPDSEAVGKYDFIKKRISAN